MRTEATLSRICDELHKNCGDMLMACQTVGVSLAFVRQWRKDDPEVDNALKEAEQVGTQGLVSAAIQRGVHGVEEDIYYRGEVVGSKRNYSDSLLTLLLKTKVPEFKQEEGGGVNVNVNVANIMPRAANYEEWLRMVDSTAAKGALPPPQTPIDVEYTEVKSSIFDGIDL